MPKEKTIVYSTNPDWKPEKDEKEQEKGLPASGQTAYIERDRKKRAGKVVTVISNLKGDLRGLQKELQKHCGSGGTVKNGMIEIQGDQRNKIGDYLSQKGYKVKFIGG